MGYEFLIQKKKKVMSFCYCLTFPIILVGGNLLYRLYLALIILRKIIYNQQRSFFFNNQRSFEYLLS